MCPNTPSNPSHPSGAVDRAEPRTVIVCLPADATADWFTTSLALADHLDSPADLAACFPVRHRPVIGWVTRWLTRRLVGARRRRGVVTRAAGGRVGRLDLRLAGQAAWLAATARWATWHQVTRGLRPALPWEHYRRRHEAKPQQLSLDDARRMFLRQPAVAAMLAHNAIPGQTHFLDPDEVDAYHAGPQAHATRHMLTAVAGQAMLTADGRWLEPASEAFTDVLAYLQQAAAHLHALPRRQQIVALAA
jgi:DNA-binding transcriptional regulator YdaS (Cro superfamily)